MAELLDRVSLNDLQMRLITAVKVQSNGQLHTSIHSLGLVNHAFGARRMSGSLNTRNSRLRALKLWYTLPALLYFQDGRMSRTSRLEYAEGVDLTTLLPWLMGCTGGTATHPRRPARNATDKAKFERATSSSRPQGQITVAARGFLAVPHAPGNEPT